MAILDDIAMERRAVVDRLRGLPDEKWQTPTLCEGWSVHHVLAHLTTPFLVSRPFCSACDRLRLTADGQVRSCLFAREESDLRTPLRSGASDTELAERLREAVRGKKKGHGIGEPGFVQPDRPMSAIGG